MVRRFRKSGGGTKVPKEAGVSIYKNYQRSIEKMGGGEIPPEVGYDEIVTAKNYVERKKRFNELGIKPKGQGTKYQHERSVAELRYQYIRGKLIHLLEKVETCQDPRLEKALSNKETRETLKKTFGIK